MLRDYYLSARCSIRRSSAYTWWLLSPDRHRARRYQRTVGTASNQRAHRARKREEGVHLIRSIDKALLLKDARRCGITGKVARVAAVAGSLASEITCGTHQPQETR